MTCPGSVAGLMCQQFLMPFALHGLQCALPYAQPGHVGASTFANSFGMIPDLASNFNLAKLRCPSRSWIVARRACLRLTRTTAGSSNLDISS